MSDDGDKQQSWSGKVLEASSMVAKQCPHCGTLVLILKAVDGTPFAQCCMRWTS